MELNKYTTGAIFIDDKKEQVENLMNYCKSKGISTLYINPDDFNRDVLFIGYRIIFVDLAFDDGRVDVDRVTNFIRGIAENGEKHLLVVAWTQHEDDIENLKTKIVEKMSDKLPLAVLDAQKSKLLYLKTEEEFNDLISQIFKQFEDENQNLFNLLEWEECHFKAIREEFDTLIEKTYSTTIDPKLINQELGLFSSKTLMPDKFLSAIEILNIKVNDNVLYRINAMNDFDLEFDNAQITLKEKFKFNYEMLFEKNIYSINIPGSLYKVEQYDYEQLRNLKAEGMKIDNSNIDDLFTILSSKNIEFKYICHVVLNITPNCTYATKNKNTTFCEGYLIVGIKNYEENYTKIKDLRGYSKKALEKCSFSFIDKNDDFSYLIICFDCCSSTISNTYEKIFQMKNNVKIKIQQRFSSWVNRVGDNIYD